jgi:hypothetical protein
MIQFYFLIFSLYLFISLTSENIYTEKPHMFSQVFNNNYNFSMVTGVNSKTRQTLKHRFICIVFIMSDSFKLFTGLFCIKHIFMPAFDIHLLVLKIVKPNEVRKNVYHLLRYLSVFDVIL